jgi:hypothetical protein
MWGSLSKDVLLYEVTPYCDPEQFLMLLQLNKRTNRIVSEYKTYMSIKEARKIDKQLAIEPYKSCELGDYNWAVYYLDKYQKDQLISYICDRTTFGGNLDLFKHIEQNYAISDYEISSFAFINAIECKNPAILNYMMSKYHNLDYATGACFAAKLGNIPLLDTLATIVISQIESDRITEFWQRVVWRVISESNDTSILVEVLARSNFILTPEEFTLAVAHDKYITAHHIYKLVGSDVFIKECIDRSIDSVTRIPPDESTKLHVEYFERFKFACSFLKSPDWIAYATKFKQYRFHNSASYCEEMVNRPKK